jgi:predicted transcriptional regulator
MVGDVVVEKIHMPKNISEKERYMALSPDNRKKYLEKLVKEIIYLNKGITVSEIVNALLLSYDAVRRHLTTLESTGEVYCVRYGQSEVFFPNGRNIHAEDEMDLQIGDSTFAISVLSNQFDDFLLIQEKKAEPNGKYKAKGAIMVQLKSVPEFFRKTSEFFRNYNDKKQEMVA